MAKPTEYIFLGLENENKLILKADGVAADLGTVIKMELQFQGSIKVSSDNLEDDPIKWAQTGYETGEVRMTLGQQSIPEGIIEAFLIIYDPINDNGLYWGTIRFVVTDVLP